MLNLYSEMLNLYKYIMMISTVIIFILFIILILIICFIVLSKHNCSKHGGTSESKHQKTFENKHHLYTMSYTISGEDNGLDFSQLRQLFKEIGEQNEITFVEVPVTEKAHISFGTFKNNAVVKGEVKRWNYDPLFFKQKTAIKNTLGEHHQLINKSELYDTIKRLIPNGIKYLPKSYNSQELTQAFHAGTIKYPLIVKKDNVPQQQAIRIVLSKEECMKAIKELGIKSDNGANKGDGYIMTAVASEYITNPLLIDGKKFHLRILFLLSVISGITKCSVFPIYRVRTAEHLYKNDDYLNDKIHLTGGHHTTQLYHFPEDFKKYGYDIDTIEKNLNACNKTIAMAMTMANVKNYPESYAGYHLYGADIMITDDYHPYLLEINSKPGYTQMGDSEKGYDAKYVKYFSYQLFSFILHSTVFPTLGISRPPIYDAEFIGNGTLTPYANILTGHNKCFLIPLYSSTENEIKQAEQIHFFHKGAMFHSMVKDCNPNHIFLIAKTTQPLHSGEKNQTLHSGSVIIGYIVVNAHHKICVAIAKEYQNRGIATAMVAQLLEIFQFVNIIHKDPIPTISTNNVFMRKIHDKISHLKKETHDNHHYLTYKINNNSILNLDKYMKQSNSQFVSFIYYLVMDAVIKKNSTGSKYNSEFIYQGAELKSTLNAPFLFNIYQFKKKMLDTKAQYLDTRAQYLDPNLKYISYDYSNHKIHLKHDITEHDLTDPNYLIEEYYPPYLIDEKLMCIRFYLVIYISKNEIIQFYIFPKNTIITAKDKYDIHKLNDLHVYLPSPMNTEKIHPYPSDLPSNESLQETLQQICMDISTLNITTYAESNSGFLECNIYIKFIKKHGNYIPIIHKFFNYNGIYKRLSNILSDEFIDEYYQWLKKCVILPHFGLHSGKKIYPIYGKIIATTISTKIQYSIIEKIHIEFNHDRTKATATIGANSSLKHIVIGLNVQQNIISVIDVNMIDINILINVIFILMQKLSAYYSPIIVSLVIPHNIILKHKKEMDEIAFELEFAKTTFAKEDYYIKKC